MKRPIVATATAALLSLALAQAAGAQDHAHHADSPASDSAAVAEVVDGFHEALARGDTAAVLALLSPDARIVEGGGVETIEEYEGHHLPADLAFAAAVERERGPLEVIVRGDIAWVISTSQAHGTYRDREIDSRGAELMVLARGDGGWRIEAVHWSSR